MGDVAIRINNLSKQYKIGEARNRHDTFKDLVTHGLTSLFRRNSQSAIPNLQSDTIWALKDVSLEVKQGEALGIIGRNGAGKSTLLKILSRITEPTSGRAEIYGRVGSLLEVGIGFDRELTGRENIYLNGAVLGMRKAEIDRKFDEIVDFSGVEKFIDTPVKRYSSGMHVRLAFAVAAHLEPEILIVDEVLAVGDANFQKKCLNKMETVGKHGRTVLFVSHNMPAVIRLCQRTMLLDQGIMLQDGPSGQVVSAYLHSGVGTMAEREWSDLAKAPGTDVIRLRAVRVRTEDGHITETTDIRRPVGIEMEYEVLKPGYVLHPHFTLHNEEGAHLFAAQDVDSSWQGRPRPTGRYTSTGWIPGNLLSGGKMVVGPAMRSLGPNTLHYYEPDAVCFLVIDTFDPRSARGNFPDKIPGVVRPLLKWETRFAATSTQLGDSGAETQ